MALDFGWDKDLCDEDNLLVLLGLCGCGCPEHVLRLFLRSLDRLDSERERRDYRVELIDNFGMDNALDSDLVWAHLYQLEHLDLLEHGCSAWCGWLTPKGKFIRDKLRGYLSTLSKEVDE